jgi:hypothetical protein
MNAVVNHINARLQDWYAVVKRDYGVVGSGFAKYNNETNEVEIHYIEDSVKCLFKHYWHSDFKIETIFDIWQTEANPEVDAI